MKKRLKIWIYASAIMGVSLMLSSSCSKKDDNNITMETGTVIDIEGNVYKTVKIGTQWWMAENLKTTKYDDGSSIPLVIDDTAWNNLSTPGYCWYNNDTAYKIIYGALYNWFTVNTGKLAPTGWHVPTDDDWTTLLNYLGGSLVAGGKMKSTGNKSEGTGLWRAPNTGATNESGFTALPGGIRENIHFFTGLTFYTIFWSSTNYSSSESRRCWLSYENMEVGWYMSLNTQGSSVRCIKN